MNILEQEDIIKGMPDASLQQEMSVPSGQVPQFLVLSEIQRRTDMRERFEASEPQPTTTVRDQIMAEGLGASVPQPNMPTMPPMAPPNMGGMPPNSPVPARPNSSSPPLPVGDAPQGLAGMGVQMSSGGVVRMQEAGRVPEFYSGNPSDYPPQGLLSKTHDVLTPDLDLGFWKWAANKGIDLGKTSAEAMFNFYKDYQLEVPYETMERYSKVSPELAYQTYTGRDPEEQSVWAEALEDYRAGMTPERYPFVHMDSQAKSQLPMGDYLMYGLREGGKRNLDAIGTFGPAVGERALDLITSGIGGDPTVSPETQREEWTQAVEDVVTGGAEAVDQQRRDLAQMFSESLQQSGADLIQQRRDLSQLFVDDLMGGGEKVLQDRRARQDAIEDMYATTGEQARLDEFPSRSGAFDLEMGNIEEGTSQQALEMDQARGDGDGFLTRLTRQFKADFGDVGNWFSANADRFLEDNAHLLNKEESTSENETGQLTAGGDPVLASLLSQQDDGPMININPRLLDPTSSNFIQTGAGGNNYPITQDLMDQRDALKGAQEDVAANLQELITQTRQDAKQQAFYLGMAALGGGIAGGDISKGMEDAVQVASSTVARGEQSAAPLQAAMATQPTQAAKDSIEALTSIASVDAAYKAITADIRRQGRLDRQSENSLRSSAITAAQRAIDELGFELGLNTPEQIAGAINQVVTLLMGQVTNPYYGQATSPDMRFYADDQQLIDQQLIDRSASNATGS